MTKRPTETSAKDVADDAVETDFSIPADADLRPSPTENDSLDHSGEASE
jgi:hypothetical protein